MKKILGWVLLLLPFITIFAIMSIMFGLGVLIILGMVFIPVVCIIAGIHLITKEGRF